MLVPAFGGRYRVSYFVGKRWGKENKMVSLSWCLKQKKGIQLIEPSDNLCLAYLKDADDSLKIMLSIQGKWKVITAYYSCYNAFYALLLKAGIKSEIHDCTLALMHLFQFTAEDISFLSQLKTERIDAQYYLKNVLSPNDLQVKSFVLKCKHLAAQLDDDTIAKMRGLVKNG